jgi:HD-like signal output (HDOD) protein
LVKTQRLPSPSATALRVIELANRDDASVKELAAAITADPAMAARLLRYANSPMVGACGQITTIRQAVVQLGLRAIKVMALSFSLVRDRDFSQCPNFSYDDFWAQAAATAVACRGVIRSDSPDARDEAFLCGLLASIGKLAFASAAPLEYDPVLAIAGSVTADTRAVEREAFGTDYVEVGSELLNR